MSYIGRFAPSPTGLLHFGSLLAATTSYLEARTHQGLWLLRIEDLDKPREQAGAAHAIIQTLLDYGFEWDRDIVYQSQRLEAYQEALETLQDFCYPCTCSRKQLNLVAEHGLYGLIYPGTCRNKPPHPTPLGATAIRLRVTHDTICFQDAVQGLFCQNLAQTLGDFIIRRADGLYAYQLAVVVDDAWQNISHIIRGADLLDNTPRQMYLQTLLRLPQPQYLHIPIATHTDGQKLSKQTKAAPIPTENKAEKLKTLCAALQFLGQTPPHFDNFSSLADCWQWALTHWNSRRIPTQRQLEQTP